MNQSLIVFDVGQVLIEARMTWQEVFEAINLRPSIPEGCSHLYDLETYLPYEGGYITEREYLESVAKTFRLDSVEQAKTVHQSIIGEEFEGVSQLISELKAAGLRTATLSNNNPLHWARISDPELYPGVCKIENLIASFMLGAFKPEMACYLSFCERLAVKPSEIVFLDDSVKNVAGADIAGWTAHVVPKSSNPLVYVREVLKPFLS